MPFDTAHAFGKRGADVIVDTVFERRECADQCLRALDAPILVGLYCGVAELERREAARGDRPRGLAARQAGTVHGFCRYDLRLDTDRLGVEACAAEIEALLRTR